MLTRFQRCLSVLFCAALVWTSAGEALTPGRLQVGLAFPSLSRRHFNDQALVEPSTVDHMTFDRRGLLGGSLAAWTLAVFGVPNIFGQSRDDSDKNKHGISSSDVDRAVTELEEVTKNLSDATNMYAVALDAAIQKSNLQSHRKGRQDILAADSDWFNEEDVAKFEAVRKLVAARALVAGSDSDLPKAVKKSQELIMLALQRMAAAEKILARLKNEVSGTSYAPLVSNKKAPTTEQKQQAQLELAKRREQLEREKAMRQALQDPLEAARAKALKAARSAFVVLPFNLPPLEHAPGDRQEPPNIPVLFPQPDSSQNPGGSRPKPGTPQKPPPEHKPASDPMSNPENISELMMEHALPLAFKQGEWVNVFRDEMLRVDLNFAGPDKTTHRALFYQEVRIKRIAEGRSFQVLYRSRVSVDPATGRQELVQAYKPVMKLLEGFGDLEAPNLGASTGDELWQLEPTEGSVKPSSTEDVQMVLARLATQQEDLRRAAGNFKDIVNENLQQHDHVKSDAPLDQETQFKLFLCRSYLGKSAPILAAASDLQGLAYTIQKTIDQVKELAAWGNKIIPGEQSTPISAGAWENLQDAAEREIRSAHLALTETAALLPPTASELDVQFPGLEQGDRIVVHIHRAESLGRAKLIQEIFSWREDGRDARRAIQVISQIEVDPQTGDHVEVSDSQSKVIPQQNPNERLDIIYERTTGNVTPKTADTPEPGPVPVSVHIAPLLTRLADRSLKDRDRRRAVAELSRLVPSFKPIPETLGLDFLGQIAANPSSVSFLIKEMKAADLESAANAARIVGAMPVPPSVKRTDLLKEIFDRIPNDLTEGRIPTPERRAYSAWNEMVWRSTPADVLSFFKILFGSSHLHLEQDPQGNRVLRLLLSQSQYHQALRRDAAARALLVSRFKSIQKAKSSDSGEFADLVDLMVFVGTPDLKKALEQGQGNLAPQPGATPDPTLIQRYARVVEALVRLSTWKIYEEATIEELAREAAFLDPANTKAWEALKRYADIKMAEPETVSRAVALFKQVVSEFGPSEPIPGDIRLGYPLLHWLPSGAMAALERLNEDFVFVEKLLAYIVGLSGHNINGPEEALSFLRRLHFSHDRISWAIGRLTEAENRVKKGNFVGAPYLREERGQLIGDIIRQLRKVGAAKNASPAAIDLEMAA